MAGFGRQIKIYFENLNLFSSIPPATDENKLRNEKISTRLFLIFLILFMTILLLYTSLIDNTQTIEISTPSLTQYLQIYSKYEQRLTCPCTKISIDYSTFLQTDYKFHEICSSIFVTQNWFNYLTEYRLTTELYLYDYRSVINKIFQGLSIFCNLTKERISNDLNQFYSTQLISASLISNQTFQIQIQSIIQQFISRTIQDFLFSISLIRKTTHTNQIFSGLQTNYNFSTTSQFRLITSSTTYDNCSCLLSPKCTQQAQIYDFQGNTTLWNVPGFFIGCYVIESLLQSNLLCFYNQSCIDQLQTYLTVTTSMNVTQLDRSQLKQFYDNSTIEELVNNLMIEEWNSSVLFENYYSECEPLQCIYTETMKNSALYIVTTVIGLIGGLVTVLKLVVPRLVIFIRKRKSEEDEPRTPIKETLLNWNLFPSIPPSNDEQKIRNQRLATKVFVILLVLLLIVLLLYTSLIDKTVTVQIDNPTITKYFYLYSKYSDRLTCPCKKISIKYEKLFSLQYEFHEICSSAFIDEHWFEYLSQHSNNLFVDDFRLTDTSVFQSLNILCELISETISDRLIQLYSDQLISSSLVSNQTFQVQIQSLVQQFISATTNDFLLSLSTIQSTTQSNGLLSSYLTNYYYIYNQSGFVNTTSRKWNNCDCIYSSRCISPSLIYNYSNNQILWNVPGFFIGCYIIESLLQSNLLCFYNQSCIDQLQTYLTVTTSMNVTQLDRSRLKQFYDNSTIEELVNNLMIEEWNSSVLFENYYSECEPLQCIYTETMKNSALYIVTTVIGLIGGLVTVLKLVVPRLVIFIRRERNLSNENERLKLSERVRNNLKKSRDYLKNFNIFQAFNENEIYDEILSTRLFLFLLILFLLILLLYTSLVNIKQIIDIEEPTMKQYLELYSKYSDTLKCPCTKISTNYKEILSIQYNFHEICSSTFLNHDWIVYISQCDVQYPMYCNDFRCSGPYYFQTILSYCELVNKTISESLIQFYSNRYISSSVISYDIFQSQTNEFITQFISGTTNNFLSSISAIRGITYSNGLLVGLLYNFMLKVNTTTNQITLPSETYKKCYCDHTSTCMTLSGFYYSLTGIPLLIIPGFKKGCYMIDSLLKSDLQCFYNQTCIDQIKSFYSISSSMDMIPLNFNLLNHFTTNSTMQNVTDQLMVDQWNTSISYENYFNQCYPLQCTYVYTMRNTIIYIITTIIGLIGGLITTLKFIVPKFVKFIRNYIQKKGNRIDSIGNPIQT